jgi:hypothetical protein
MLGEIPERIDYSMTVVRNKLHVTLINCCCSFWIVKCRSPLYTHTFCIVLKHKEVFQMLYKIHNLGKHHILDMFN